MGHNFPSNPLLVIVSPLLLVMEDQVKWPRPRGFAAAYIGESNYKDRNITVKTLIQDHPFSEFRLIGFLYIGYISLKVFLSVLNFLLLKKNLLAFIQRS